MQDLEFTIQEGKLWMLQTRSGKRTAKAALKIAVDMVEGRPDHPRRSHPPRSIPPRSISCSIRPSIPKAKREVIGQGLPASPGAASGEIVFDPDEAERLKAQRRARDPRAHRNQPEDIHGMHAAEGILTTRGGMTSHAAVVARGMGKPCVSGAGGIRVDYDAGTLTPPASTLNKGEIITIDGTTGQVMKGAVRHHQAGAVRRFRHHDGMGRCHPPHEGARQCRNARRCPRRPRFRRRRHRPLPHRAHVLRGRPHRSPCAR